MYPAVPRSAPARVCMLVIVGEFAMAPDARVGRLGQAEVEHLHGAVGAHHDVGGLEIAVDDAPLVSGLERLDDLRRDAQRIVQRDRPAREPLGEVLPFDELHRQRAPSTGRGRFFESVDLRDVRVVERRERASFPVEPRQPFLVPREQLGQDLDRDRPLQPAVDRLVDLAHASGADPAHDLVRSDPLTDCDGHWGVGRIIPAKSRTGPAVNSQHRTSTPNAPPIARELGESRSRISCIGDAYRYPSSSGLSPSPGEFGSWELTVSLSAGASAATRL